VRAADGAVVREGMWAFRDESGGALAGEFKDDRKHGLWTTWYPSGVVHSTTEYLQGRPHGLQIEWNEQGERVSERQWKNGRLHGEVLLFQVDGVVRERWEDGRRIEPPAAPSTVVPDTG
jgi:antitoxin component YwqK of YwqJK toxin-antitoxin module